MGDGVRRAGRCMHEREGELETWRGMEVKGRYHTSRAIVHHL